MHSYQKKRHLVFSGGIRRGATLQGVGSTGGTSHYHGSTSGYVQYGGVLFRDGNPSSHCEPGLSETATGNQSLCVDRRGRTELLFGAVTVHVFTPRRGKDMDSASTRDKNTGTRYNFSRREPA